MVIQSNMSPKAIISVWKETSQVFTKYHLSINNLTLEEAVSAERLEKLIKELNQVVGSSETTCVEGG